MVTPTASGADKQKAARSDNRTEGVRMDNGPELIAWALRDWCGRSGRCSQSGAAPPTRYHTEVVFIWPLHRTTCHVRSVDVGAQTSLKRPAIRVRREYGSSARSRPEVRGAMYRHISPGPLRYTARPVSTCYVRPRGWVGVVDPKRGSSQ